MTNHIVAPKGPVPRCDFCSAVPVCWNYPCRNFSRTQTIAGITAQFNSKEDWAACEVCHRLIAKGDRERLVRRSVKRYRKLYPALIPLTFKLARELQDDFWRNREGEPQPAASTWENE